MAKRTSEPALSRYRAQSGVVMVTATLILLILSLIVSYQMERVRGQLRQAQLMRDKAQACEQAQNVFNHVVFNILTRGFRELSGNSAEALEDEQPRFWNWHGQAFGFEGGRVTLQDTAGLLTLHDLGRRRGRLLMRNLGMEEEQIVVFSDSLADWRDEDDLVRLNGAETEHYRAREKPGPRNDDPGGLIELQWVRGYPENIHPPIEDYVTLYATGYFNPMHAPDELLRTVLDGRAEQVIEQRSQQPMSTAEFRNIAGLSQNQSVLFAPPRETLIRVSASHGKAQCRHEMVLEANPTEVRDYGLRRRY